MNTINNKSETFVREIRYVEIYPAESLPYLNNYLGYLPDAEDLLFKIRINPDDYERKIPTKKRSGNYFFDIDINFPLLDLKPETRTLMYEILNRSGFCVVLVSNTEKMMLGNKLEPLTVDILDGMKDNASGNDQFNISITGETIIQPKGKEF